MAHMSRHLVDHGGPVTDLGALNHAFGCAARAEYEALDKVTTTPPRRSLDRAHAPPT